MTLVIIANATLSLKRTTTDKSTVDRVLKTHMQKQIENHNAVSQRTNDACKWISDDVNFQKWLGVSSGVNWISLFGEMGYGKTVTTAYVVDALGTQFCLPGSGPTIVCSYYCRDDKETSNIRNIYCNLLWQLLNRVKRLKRHFQDWYKKTKSEIGIDPTWDENRLRDLLFDMLGSLRQSTFLVIDGFDECESEAREHLLTLFEKLHDHQAHLKLFISCRPDEEVKRRMPKSSCVIRLHKSKVRDKIDSPSLGGPLSGVS